MSSLFFNLFLCKIMSMKKAIILLLIGIFFLTLDFVLQKKDVLTNVKGGKMKITSVFEHNGYIPSIYTCDGQDLAPELAISGVPEGAKELVLIVDDPDAPMGTWVHWLVYNLPANSSAIDAKKLPQEAKQGITDFGRVGWGGPCPPGGTHRYFFKLYALDKNLDLEQGLTKLQLEKAIKESVIEKAELIGLYKRIKS